MSLPRQMKASDLSLILEEKLRGATDETVTLDRDLVEQVSAVLDQVVGSDAGCTTATADRRGKQSRLFT